MLCGMVAYFAVSSAPTGWLKANGGAVSRSAYANLFAAIGTTFGAGDGSTTFTLPDFRGEFIRGWDDGRNVDTSRSFGSAQGEVMKNHTHSCTTDTKGNHNHFFAVYGGNFGNGSGAASLFTGHSYRENRTTNTTGNHNHTVTTGNPSTGGGPETRQRNVAMLACIKY